MDIIDIIHTWFQFSIFKYHWDQFTFDCATNKLIFHIKVECRNNYHDGKL